LQLSENKGSGVACAVMSIFKQEQKQRSIGMSNVAIISAILALGVAVYVIVFAVVLALLVSQD